MLSIVVPIFNGEKYLEDFINSICAQTYQDFEVIFVDDGSTDNSANIIKASLDKGRFYYLFQKNKGAGAARNLGFSHCVGDYVWFADCDDLFSPSFVEKMYGKAKATSSEVMVCLCDNFDDVSKAYYQNNYSVRRDLLPENYKAGFNSKSVPNDFFHLFVWWPWDKIFSVNLIKRSRLKFDSLKSTNDLLFVCMACLYSRQILLIEEVLAHHRVNVKNSVSNSRDRSALDSLSALKNLLLTLHLSGFWPERKSDFCYYFVAFVSWHLSTLSMKNSYKLYCQTVLFAQENLPDIGKDPIKSYGIQNGYLKFLLQEKMTLRFFAWLVVIKSRVFFSKFKGR